MANLPDERVERLHDLSPVKRLDIWRSGIVPPQTPQLGQREGEELVLHVKGLKVEEMVLFVVWRDNEVPIPAGLCCSQGSGVRYNSRCLDVCVPEGLDLHLSHEHWPLVDRHDGRWVF